MGSVPLDVDLGSCIAQGGGDRGVDEDGAELEQLAGRARAGDRRAMESLLRLDYDRLHAVCWRVLREDECALDATQEALISISRHIVKFDGRSRYSTWSYRIAVNAALDEARRRQRHRTVSLERTVRGDEGGESHERDPGEVVAGADSASGVEDVVVDRLSVRAALERLPREQRDALVLRHELDLDYAEIASIANVPIGTVRSRISRGRVAIAAELTGRPGSAAGAGTAGGTDDDLLTTADERNSPTPASVEQDEL
jgi:RNA polymerase sigma-70 factor (ECF subfamily)